MSWHCFAGESVIQIKLNLYQGQVYCKYHLEAQFRVKVRLSVIFHLTGSKYQQQVEKLPKPVVD